MIDQNKTNEKEALLGKPKKGKEKKLGGVEKKKSAIAKKLQVKECDEEVTDSSQQLDEKVEEIGSLITAPRRLGDWFITHRIGEGTFAKIFVGRSVPTSQYYAIKVESHLTSMDFTAHEVTVMRMLTYPEELPHLPKCVYYVRQKTLNYFAMTLFGENLRDLKLKCPERRFLRGTWSRIGIQVLYAIKLIHEKGFIHRDIKPDNLMMGAPEDAKRWRIVHVIDFGLSRQWAWPTNQAKPGKLYARPLRSKASFRGSLNYASPNAHFNYELGRKDDLWSLLFTLVDLNDRLPWFGERNHNILVPQKTNAKLILERMPKILERFVEHLLECRVLQRPNYHMFYNILKGILTASGQTPASKYTFEDCELNQNELKNRNVAAWEEETGAFFAKDSVKIDSVEQCMKKKEEWKTHDVDIFETVSKDLAESKKLENNGNNELGVEKTPTDKNKMKLYNELRSILPEPTYRLCWKANRNRFKKRHFDEKEKVRQWKVYEGKNYLTERIEYEGKKLLDTESAAIENVSECGKSEEKEEEVNMADVEKDREDVLKDAQMNVIRMKKKETEQAKLT